MSGRLTAILFSGKTAQTLYNEMQDSPDALIDRTLIDMLQNLECDEIEVEDTEGDCVIVIETFLPRHTTARLTLMNAENHEVIQKACTDLNPLIDSGRTCADDYDDASQCLSADNEDMNLRTQKKIQAISRTRFQDIGKIFGERIKSDVFKEHLVDALDLATRTYERQKSEQAADIATNLLSRFTQHKL